MASGGDDNDPQRIKRIAAAAYDYDRDPRWSEYWSNVLVPPYMASRPDVVEHYKRKFYQRFIDPDLVVEPMTSTNSSQTARATAPSSSTSTAANSRPRSSGPGTASSSRPERTNSLRMDRRIIIQFSINAWVLIVSLVGIIPIMPSNISSKAFRLSLLGTMCSSLYLLYTQYGTPRAWNLPAIQVWLQSIIATKDLIHFLYCLMLITSQLHLKFGLIPVLCWALEHVAKFLRRNFSSSSLYRKYLEDPCLWVETNTTTLNILSSYAEIALGFLLILSLFTWQRSIIQTFIYWHLLKLMYHVPATAGYHQSVWSKIGRIVIPYVHRYAPFLNTPISAVQRWWLR